MGNKNSGPRPRPTALKVLRGNPGKRALNQREPIPPAGEIRKPVTLSEGAARMWDEWVPICLYMGTMTPSDIHPMATLCELQAILHRAASLKDHPETFDKAVTLERNHAGLIRPYYAMFGLEPSARARLQVRKPDEAPVSKWAGAMK